MEKLRIEARKLALLLVLFAILLGAKSQGTKVESANSSSVTNLIQANKTIGSKQKPLHVQVAAIHVDKSEFPLSKLLFELTLKLALEGVERRFGSRKFKLSVSLRSANTCSNQYASAIAAEEYYTKRARLFIVSGCDDAIKSVSRLASGWKVPIMTAAGLDADLSDKSIYKTLIRVAFSLQTAVEFLLNLLRSFDWRRVNLIVDESDANSSALKSSIAKHVHDFNKNSTFKTELNLILLDFKNMLELTSNNNNNTNKSINSNNLNQSNHNRLINDDWPNEVMDGSIRDALKQGSVFSRVNILLIPQVHLRKFMLTVYDVNMANGLYTFINMPLILLSNDDQIDASSTNPLSQTSLTKSGSHETTTSGDNIFVWHSINSKRNRQARLAFESLMSIFIRIPTTKAYLSYSNRLLNLAKTEMMSRQSSSEFGALKTGNTTAPVQISLSEVRVSLGANPYSASIYDCLQIYSIILDELIQSIDIESDSKSKLQMKRSLHYNISQRVKNRRYENMLTGNIFIDPNGDRETDYTLDDMNFMTGRFWPVRQYKGETKEMIHLSTIHWSSDLSVGPTIDNVDCNLLGKCPGKPMSKFFFTAILLASPVVVVVAFLLYFVHNYLSLEAQLVDYWWKISFKDVEIIPVRRKNLVDGSSVVEAESQVSGSHAAHQSHKTATHISGASEMHGTKGTLVDSCNYKNTTITMMTGDTSGESLTVDACYGNINLAVYKCNKVALKPISKFHQSRSMMIEIRSIREVNHNNLCRFIGIIVDDPHKSLVTEYCPKGSLREFFQNESMVIDWTFKCSIINDVIAGLSYLHSSPLDFHGRLKSTNCLVNSRFVVKLSDYGLGSLYNQMDEASDEMELMGKKLWMAPEFLKSNCKIAASKKGDVYSLGLLLYEIITNEAPFYDSDQNGYVMPLDDLIAELKTNGPSTKTGVDLSIIDTTQENGSALLEMIELMKSCWRLEHSNRPSLVVVSTAIKSITKGASSKKLLENLAARMEQYTNNLESLVDAKLASLVEEKFKMEELLYQFVPRSIASLLKEGQSVEPEAFECVTVFYSDIVGFTSLSSESSPMEVIDFLSDLYLCFDEILEQHDIFKVDMIGDAYIVASGLPQRNGDRHVIEIASVALELRDGLAKFKIPHKPGRSLQMRVGIHSGPCIAGIVGGSNMPKYCVFGETLTTGKFMESTGLPMKIHVTEQSKKLLDLVEGFKLEPRTPKITKDGLPLQTYWLNKE